MTQLYNSQFLDISTPDERLTLMNKSNQRSSVGAYINFSITADGNFGISLNGALTAIPQVAQVAAILQGLLSIFGLSQAPAEPERQPKTVTIDAGVNLATLFGASQGVAFLVQVLKGKIEAVKNYIQGAVTSIQNLFECILKNPLLAAALIAKLIRQGWIQLPQPVKEALEKARDALNKIYGLNIIINNPYAEYLKNLRDFLMYKFPPPILLPFIPEIPGCSPAFYSGRPPASVLNQEPIVTDVEPQVITTPGGFTTQLNLTVNTIPIQVGPNAAPSLALTDAQVEALLGSYDPYNLYLSGTARNNLNEDLLSSFPTITNTNSVTKQVQDKLITASNKVVSDVVALNKDISRAGFIPRPSPLDDLLCKPVAA